LLLCLQVHSVGEKSRIISGNAMQHHWHHKGGVMNKMKNLIKLALLLILLSGLAHPSFSEEVETISDGKPEKIVVQQNQDSPPSHKEDILKETQIRVDRAVNFFVLVATVMGIFLAALVIVLTIATILGLIQFRKWKKIMQDLERDAATVRGIRKRVEEDANALREEIKEIPPLSSTERPSKELKERIDEFSQRLDLLELLGTPIKTEDFLKRAAHFFYRGEYESALKHIEKAIEMDPSSAMAWTNKATVLGNLGRLEESLSAAEKAVQINPEEAFSWVSKSNALNRLTRYEESLSAAEKAIEKTPNFATPWNSKACALIRLGRYPEAIKAIDNALELDQNLAEAWYNRACAHSLEGDKEKSLSSLKKAIEIDPAAKQRAKEDEDFKSLWDDEDFKGVVD